MLSCERAMRARVLPLPATGKTLKTRLSSFRPMIFTLIAAYNV